MHEQVSFLEREAVHVVVGTPARVLKLCELSKLKLSELKVSEEEVFPSFSRGKLPLRNVVCLLVLPLFALRLPFHLTEACFLQQVLFLDKQKDQKQRSLLSLRDVQKDLWTFYEKHVTTLLRNKQIEVSLL